LKDNGDNLSGFQIKDINEKHNVANKPSQASSITTRKQQKLPNHTKNTKPKPLTPKYPLRSQTKDIIIE